MHAMYTNVVEFGSLLTYAPRGISQKADEAGTVMTYLKSDKVTKSGILMSEYMARALKKEIGRLPFVGFFNSKVTLVPAPKSSLLKPGTLWVPERLTTAMVKNGFR